MKEDRTPESSVSRTLKLSQSFVDRSMETELEAEQQTDITYLNCDHLQTITQHFHRSTRKLRNLAQHGAQSIVSGSQIIHYIPHLMLHKYNSQGVHDCCVICGPTRSRIRGLDHKVCLLPKKIPRIQLVPDMETDFQR